MIKLSKDGKVKFDSKTHTYYKGETILTGVTTYISQFKNYFDADLIAGRYAIKHGLVKEDVLKMWEEKGRLSREAGTAVHNVIENYVCSGSIQLLSDCKKQKQAENLINTFFLTGRLEPVECEMLVYNDVLASQIDLIAKNKKGEHFMLDWKTNDTIERCSFKDQRMLPPYNSYPDCSYYHYSMQLSIYKELCTDYDIKGLYIVHINDQKYDFIKPENIKLII